MLKSKKGFKMARKFSLLTTELLEEANKAYAKLKEGKIAKKLLAIIACSEHSAQEVGKILKVSPFSIYKWIRKFSEEGIEGLKETRGGNYPQKLLDTQWEEIKRIVISGRDFSGVEVNWTLKKLKEAIKERYGVNHCIESIRRNLNKRGVVLRRPRPRHYQSNPIEQESFKKNERRTVKM